MRKIDKCIFEVSGKRGSSYKVRVPYYDKTGKRREFNKSFLISRYAKKVDALEDAKRWRDERLVESHQKIIVKPKHKYTLDEVFEATISKRSKSFETNRKWRVWYKKYIASIIPGNTMFNTIDWDDISSTLNAMIDNSTQDMINRITTIWKKMCAYAEYQDIINKNPMIMLEVEDKKESKKASKSRDKRLDLDLFKKLLNDFPYRKNDIKEAFLEMIVLIIMAYVGLRPAEVFVLCKCDFDLINRTIHIYRRLGSTTKEKWVEVPLGNKGYERYVHYPSQLDTLIKTLIDTSYSEKLFYMNDKYLNSDVLSNDVKRISDGKLRSYMLRHAFSNDLIINKENGKEDM